MQEALWCLTAHAAARLGERGTAARAAAALRDARAEDAGAASGMLTLGPVARYLAEAEACAARTHRRRDPASPSRLAWSQPGPSGLLV